MIRKAIFAVTAVLAVAASSQAALLVTKSESDQIRTQTTGAGTYNAVDFSFTMSDNADFLNYRLIMTADNGALAIQDPAKAQRDRQSDSINQGNTAGSVDTYMNTVASFAGKDSDGNTASFVFNTYNPGSANPPLNMIDWSVFDTATGDDNSVTNADGTTFTAPYQLARVLTTPGTKGTWSVQVFDSANITGQTFTGTWGIPEPASVSLLGLAMVGFCGVFRRR
jgi:hypothetical protein